MSAADPAATPKRVALVTGAGRGIGRAIALALADDGADVALVARSGDELDAVAAEVDKRGRRAIAVPTDVTDPDAVARAAAAAASLGAPPSVLVNNAGIAPSMKFAETDLDTWNRVLAVNLTSACLMSLAVLPSMLKRGFGRIVNVASTAAKQGYPYTAAYTASKHGLLGLTRALAVELAGRGVTVNAVCPGFTRTAIAAAAAQNIAAKTGRTRAQAEQELARMSPAGRLIEPEEVAAAVVFLAGDGAGGITGQGWNIDGGAVQS